jgi:transposase-like protein
MHIMVDKDMNEVAALKTVFHEADIELCLFHVQKALRLKITSLSCSAHSKDKLRELMTKCCYAASEEAYNQAKDQLPAISPEFSSYFDDNWDNIKECWTHYSRSQWTNLGNRTNNRIESYHQKIKSEVPKNAPLDVMFKNLLLIINTLESEVGKRLFYDSVRHPANRRYPHIQNKVTPFAYEHLLKIIPLAEKFVCEQVAGDHVILKDGDREHHGFPDKCTCST